MISERRSVEELIKDTKSDNIDSLGITSHKEYDKFYKKSVKITLETKYERFIKI